MTGRLYPDPSAQARINALGQHELHAFLDEVPQSDIRRFAGNLPSVPGFRKTSEAGISRQKEALARHLSRSSASDRDYHGLYLMWRSWIDHYIPNARTIQGLIDDLGKEASSQSDSESRNKAVEERVQGLLKKLKEESQHNRVTREKVEKLYVFSPFPETATARSLIASVKSAADVERDATLSRLKEGESDIRALKAEINSLRTKLEAVAGEFGQSGAAFTEFGARLEDIKAQAAQTELAIRGLVSPRVPPRDEGLLRDELGSVRNTSEALHRKVDELASAISDVSDVRTAITRLEQARDQSDGERELLALEIRDFTQAIGALRLDVDALMDAQTGSDQLGPLFQRIGELETTIRELGVRSVPPYETMDLSSVSRPGADFAAALRFRPLHGIGDNASSAIQTYAELAAALGGALQALGLRKTAAQVFGGECAAAVASRQVVFLQGAIAVRVARGLARAVAGAGCFRVSIPVGLQNSEEVREAAAAAQPDNPCLRAIVIEGINHTALDIVRDAVSDLVDPHTAGRDAEAVRSIVFATVVQGAAALPIEPGYLELGPVFDLDVLDWRVLAPTQPIKSGSLSLDKDDAIFQEIAMAPGTAEEAVRLARLFARKRNPAVERCFTLAHRSLMTLRTGQADVTPLQSFHFGWAFPYWQALGIDREQADSELDGGKVNGRVADARLAALLALQQSAINEGGGEQ